MTRKKKLVLTAVAAHFALVILGASHFRVGSSPLVGSFLGFYSKLSGADSGFGFFSPGVGSQLRARFEVIDSSGKAREVSLVERHNREAELKIGNIISRFWSAGHNPKLRRTLTASWAGKIFARYPHAKAVVVHLEEYRLVSSAAYREGKRGTWRLFYRGKFRANAKNA